MGASPTSFAGVLLVQQKRYIPKLLILFLCDAVDDCIKLQQIASKKTDVKLWFDARKNGLKIVSAVIFRF